MDSKELLSRYADGERNFSQMDLNGIRLRDKNLANINLSEANLRQSDLSGSNLCDANLSKADLRNSDLCATNLGDANCQMADFRNAELVGDCHGINTNYSYADFRGNALDQGIIEQSNFAFANFLGCHISQYMFSDCDFSNAIFSKTRLSEVSFETCNFVNATFKQAHLDLCFNKPNLRNTDFSLATLDIASQRWLKELTSNWQDINFNTTVFYFGYYSSLLVPDYVNSSNVIIIRNNSDLTGFDLSGCNLAYINLSGINFTNANLINAQLPEDEDEYIEAIFHNTIMPDGSIWSNLER